MQPGVTLLWPITYAGNRTSWSTVLMFKLLTKLKQLHHTTLLIHTIDIIVFFFKKKALVDMFSVRVKRILPFRPKKQPHQKKMNHISVVILQWPW